MPELGDLSQYLFSGLSVGCIYALVALGFVVVANVSGVYNFAQGDYVMLGGMVVAWGGREGWSAPVAVLLAVVGGAAVAVVQERATVAPVRGRVGVLGMVVATLGFGLVLQGAALSLWDEDPLRADAFTPGVFSLFGARLGMQVLWVWATTAAALTGLVALFRLTGLGRAMRACAINPLAARLHGIRVGRLSLTAFVLGGALGGLVGAVTVPLTLVRWNSGLVVGLIGFIAAALGGFTSPVRAVVAGLGLGVAEAVSAGVISSNYRTALVYAVLLAYLFARDLFGEDGLLRRLVVTRAAGSAGGAPRLRRAARRATAGRGTVGEAARPPLTDRLRTLAADGRFMPVVLFAAAATVPYAVSGSRALDTAIFIVLTAIGATGLVLVMGLAGQLSLGHGAFYLVSGYAAAILSARHGWNPLLALVAAVALSAAMGYAVGWLTLRFRGLNLALATLAVHLILLVFVVQQSGLTGGPLGTTGVPALSVLGFTFDTQERFFHLALGMLGVCLLVARNVDRSRIGRSLRAVGADEERAQTLGLRAWTLKLHIFVVGAAMAGLGGALWAFYLRYAAPSSWDVRLTIDLITYVVVGGLGSVYGGVAGAAVVGWLQHWIRQNVGATFGAAASHYEVVTNGVLLVAFVLLFRDGLLARLDLARLAGRARSLRERLIGGAGAGGPAAEPGGAAPAPAAPAAEVSAAESPAADGAPAPAPAAAAGNGGGPAVPAPAEAGVPVVTVAGLTRSFGNLLALDHLDVALPAGRITAMVGPNGAGKSTFVNLVSGALLPTAGEIRLHGRRIDGLRADEVARLGIARTFQTPRLFAGLTTLETVVVARDRFTRAGLGAAALRLPRLAREEANARATARHWLEFVGLGDRADVPASALPVGHQRLAQVAQAMATEPEVLLLDEPAAGLDHTETRALAALVRAIGDMGVAVLLVEHDMGMVMAVADSVVVLDHGEKIAEGPPRTVGRDPAVVEAYLGVAAV